MNPIRRYVRWLHTQWPAGHVEKLPIVSEDGSTNVPGLYVVGDLRGIPLLKFSADTGARAVRAIVANAGFRSERATGEAGIVDLVIIGAGVGGMAAALEARRLELDFRVLEATEPFSTIVNFPKGKPIYTYPREMTPAGELRITAEVKEDLLDELRRQTIDAGIEPELVRVERVRRRGDLFEIDRQGRESLRARRVVVALGRSGNFRKLGVPGEELDKVYNRLHDPKDFCDRRALVIGGGDSALETAIALALCGADVTLSHRKPELARPKPENVEKLQRLAADPAAEEVSIEGPSSERITTSAAGFLGEHRKEGRIRFRLGTQVREIRETEVVLETKDGSEVLPNDVVFPMIGRDPPLDFFRRSGVSILGEWSAKAWVGLAAMLAFVWFVYHWKSGGALTHAFEANGWFPFGIRRPGEAGSLLGTIAISAGTPAFWYTLAYSAAIVGFGARRIRRRRTPYVTAQTLSLMAIQVLPLFLLPSILLPWMGHLGAFGSRHDVITVPPTQVAAWHALVGDRSAGDVSDVLGAARAGDLLPGRVSAWPQITLEKSWGERLLLKSATAGGQRAATIRLADGRAHVRDDTAPTSGLADALFPASEWDAHGREYWRASGFILAWPLFLWNALTDRPLTLWLVIGVLQTFVIIPGLIWFWGKGAYCGWICSCGGLAETLGDGQRHKMPHGPAWSRLNIAGQVILAVALVLLGLRIAGWLLPSDHAINAAYMALLHGKNVGWGDLGFPFTYLNYKWFVDLFLVGILGTGLYFHFSGRVWCRFACPLAALMHVYSRFSRFRILSEKKKCISCNICTSVCHQGIDIMNFANKGMPMEDPECVRCSACVQSCPTGVLTFGRVDGAGNVISTDRLAASPVQMREGV